MENLVFLILANILATFAASSNSNMEQELVVKKCTDFQLTGSGENDNWNSVPWITMNLMDETENKYETKYKVLYSESGLYVLGYCEDKIISTDYTEDQGDIYNGDVFEVFLQTDESNPLYFEYEINPLNHELVILVPNNGGDFHGWSPWHYEGERKVRKAVKVYDGKAESGAKISAWSVELFFPFALFSGLKHVPPESGTKWKGNFYRIDYDFKKQIKWGWKPINTTFHEYKKFGTIIFE